MNVYLKSSHPGLYAQGAAVNGRGSDKSSLSSVRLGIEILGHTDHLDVKMEKRQGGI